MNYINVPPFPADTPPRGKYTSHVDMILHNIIQKHEAHPIRTIYIQPPLSHLFILYLALQPCTANLTTPTCQLFIIRTFLTMQHLHSLHINHQVLVALYLPHKCAEQLLNKKIQLQSFLLTFRLTSIIHNNNQLVNYEQWNIMALNANTHTYE